MLRVQTVAKLFQAVLTIMLGNSNAWKFYSWTAVLNKIYRLYAWSKRGYQKNSGESWKLSHLEWITHVSSSKTFILRSVNFWFCFLIFLLKDGSKDEETVGGLLQFWTGWPSLPIVEDKIKVSFLALTPNKVLAEADTFFKVLKIPTYHTEYDNFVKYMDLCISHGKVGFGKM